MNNKWIYTISLVVLIGVVIGCADSTTEEGSGLPTGGYIKGTVKTSRYDGKPVEFSFEHPVVDYPTEYYPEYGYQQLRVYRAEDFEGTWTGDNYSQIRFYLDSLDQDTVTFYYFRLNEIVPVQDDTVLAWGMNVYWENGRITNYQFHPSDNTITGNYSLAGQGYNGQPATITGSFKSEVRIIIDEGGGEAGNHHK